MKPLIKAVKTETSVPWPGIMSTMGRIVLLKLLGTIHSKNLMAENFWKGLEWAMAKKLKYKKAHTAKIPLLTMAIQDFPHRKPFFTLNN